MKKFMKRTMATVASAALCLTMAISASAATADEVVANAHKCGVPTEYVTELKNYLTSHSSKFSASDYDYMNQQLTNTYNTYFKSAVAAMWGDAAANDPSTLTDDQLKQAFMSLSSTNKHAIADALIAVGQHFGVKIEVSKLVDGQYQVKVYDENGSVVQQSTTGGTALNTGAGSVALEAGAAAILALAATGAVALSKKNGKSVM